MKAKWKDKNFNHNIILREFENIRRIEGDNVVFEGSKYFHYIEVFKSMIEIDHNLSPELEQAIIVKGFDKAVHQKKLIPKNIISEINKVIVEYFDTPDHYFYLVCKTNISRESIIPVITFDGCTIRFYKDIPPRYEIVRKEAMNNALSWLSEKDEDNYTYLVAKVKAKSDLEAAGLMLSKIDLLRGIWNMQINKGMRIGFGGRKQPYNEISLGVLRTLHNQDGTSSSNRVWYEQCLLNNIEEIYVDKHKYKPIENGKKIIKNLNKLHYKLDVENAIIRFTRALDFFDSNIVIIKLWSILELLTSTTNDPYDKTIKRVLFHYKDQEYHKQVLEHLRLFRNKAIHIGYVLSDLDMHVYQLNGYVKRLILFHLKNQFKFENLKSAGEFMDHNHDIDKLLYEKMEYEKKLKVISKAIKYLSS